VHYREVRVNDPLQLFADYLKITGVAHLGPEPFDGPLPYPKLAGKRLGLLNGSAWVTLWSSYFGRMFLPGVHLVNVGNEAVQLNFMRAHAEGRPCPPQANIDAFVRYAHDLVAFAQVDAAMITCSTMNRAYGQVEAALKAEGVPVIQIDMPLMERAVLQGGRILVVATHGPTVESTQALLRETAARLGRTVTYAGVTSHAAWECLVVGDVRGHNECIATAIRAGLAREEIGCVVLAQLSMCTLLFSYPDPSAAFGVPVLNSAQCGFERAREVLLSL
jgi:hypothetical protein